MIAVTSLPDDGSERRASASLAVAAALGVAVATATEREEAPLVVELAGSTPLRPGLLATPAARNTELLGRELHPGLCFAARGALCLASVPRPADRDGLGHGVWEEAALEALLALTADPPPTSMLVNLPAGLLRSALGRVGAGRTTGVVIVCGEPQPPALIALLVQELAEHGARAKLWRSGLGLLASRRALAGLDPGGEAARRSRRHAVSLSVAASGR